MDALLVPLACRHPPLLYQCATGILPQGKIAFPLRELLRKLRNVEFVLAEVTSIDAERR